MLHLKKPVTLRLWDNCDICVDTLVFENSLLNVISLRINLSILVKIQKNKCSFKTRIK